MSKARRLAAFSVRRPVATAMFFLGLAILGLIAWARIPVELFPNVAGQQLEVSFFRPGGSPELLERELLLPLGRRVASLPQVAETWGYVRGSGGSFRVRFESGADLKVRQLELQQIASDLARRQPPGSAVTVLPQSAAAISLFVMWIQLTGSADLESLYDLADERVAPRLAAVPGVSQVLAVGGAPRQVNVELDLERAAAHGVTPTEVILALASVNASAADAGTVDGGREQATVVVDGRPAGLTSLGEIQVAPRRPVLLRHVATVGVGTGRRERLFRIDGQPAVGVLVFKQESANVVSLGRALHRELDRLRDELGRDHGLGFVVSFDGAEVIERQTDRLRDLAATGFLIALAVLFLFLRQWQAVAVVAVAVPLSLLAALALLHFGGQTLNLISLFGLSVGVGLLVDNSVVVFEAIYRQLERGKPAEEATAEGVRRTARAILAASAAAAVVFLPVAITRLDNDLLQSLLEIIALSILLPLGASLLVAVGLVPLLAHRLAAPAAARRLARRREERRLAGGLARPDVARGLFSGLLASALRRPAGWVAGVGAALAVTLMVAVPLVLPGTGGGQEASRAEEVQLAVRLPWDSSLDRASTSFAHLERAVVGVPGVTRVESLVQEGGGSITVELPPADERPATLTPALVRRLLHQASRELEGVDLMRPGEEGAVEGGGSGLGIEGLLGTGPARVALSGPESRTLTQLARDIQLRLESIPAVGSWPSSRPGLEEVQVTPDAGGLAGFGLTASEMLPVLGALGRDGVRLANGLPGADGRELPIVIYGSARPGARRVIPALADMPLATPRGTLPLAALADLAREPAPATIEHHNGRRETQVLYRLAADVPGSARQGLERRVADALREVRRPPGYTLETPAEDEGVAWFRRFLAPVLLLLFLVLAITFESVTLPLLIFVSLPLTVLGATWGLALAGLDLDLMALVGVLALLGLTVNPAILLVDRMQQRVRGGGWSSGAAALAALRERARPVLMTTATTVAGLWPLSLVTGRENEIWPPFATVVMGGLVTSALLTLLMVPIGFVALTRIDRLFGRLGAWWVLAWLALSAAAVTPLLASDLLGSLAWEAAAVVLVAGGLLAVLAWIAGRRRSPLAPAAGGPPAIEVRCLRKVYGLPGPVARALAGPREHARRVAERGGDPAAGRRAGDRLLVCALIGSGLAYLGWTADSPPWSAAGWLAAGLTVAWALAPAGGATAGRGPRLLAGLAPWLALAAFAYRAGLEPLAGTVPRGAALTLALFAAGLALTQLARRTARRIAAGELPPRAAGGPAARAANLWRTFARRVAGFDLPRREVEALAAVNFRIERGMVGVLGPNGAGKTTLLRQLAGILEPTRGRITLGGVPLPALADDLASWVGYLPQDSGLPAELTAREYLDYYALLYDLGSAAERGRRVEALLAEVGLAERAGDRVGGFSGGMRQRLAIARTLLRLPPLIIVDEPTVGLDPRERIRLRNLLSRLADGRVVLFSTHVVEDVAVACERVIVLAAGRLIFDGPPAALAASAHGQVWEATVDSGEAGRLAARYRVSQQTPAEGGAVLLRLLAPGPPLGEARAVEPTLEEGYLTLVGRGLAGAAAEEAA